MDLKRWPISGNMLQPSQVIPGCTTKSPAESSSAFSVAFKTVASVAAVGTSGRPNDSGVDIRVVNLAANSELRTNCRLSASTTSGSQSSPILAGNLLTILTNLPNAASSSSATVAMADSLLRNRSTFWGFLSLGLPDASPSSSESSSFEESNETLSSAVAPSFFRSSFSLAFARLSPFCAFAVSLALHTAFFSASLANFFSSFFASASMALASAHSGAVTATRMTGRL
mmetsp:Transcript_9847/g.17725  ORF Transcript_9847/g.17725 Transcript_9847/m.17725 type:complete len:228 (-) Transcript_9847:574-1257(-)